MIYFYENNDKKYEGIKNKDKRIKQVNEFLKKAKDQRNQVQVIMGAKAINTAADKKVDIADIELGEHKDTARDSDGDLQGTKGLDNQMLL